MNGSVKQDRQSPELRRRAFYLICTAVTIGLGLASRSGTEQIPRFLAIHAGDALWAAMVYWLVRLILPGKRIAICAFYALVFSFGVEFSQLYRADWIDRLRGTTFGALILGRGFLLADLVRYTLGIVCASVTDRVLLNKRQMIRNIESAHRNR